MSSYVRAKEYGVRVCVYVRAREDAGTRKRVRGKKYVIITYIGF